MKNKQKNARATDTSEPAVYQTHDGAIALRPDAAHETVWATQSQIAKIFHVERSVVTKHVSSIFAQEELENKSNVQKMHTAGSAKKVTFYSLDIVLAVGYRTNSARAIKFRRWANDVLKRYLVEGYAIDRKRLAESAARAAELREAIESIAATGDAAKTLDDARGLLSLVGRYAKTWSALERYDRGEFGEDAAPTARARRVRLDPGALLVDLWGMRDALAARGEGSEFFARERHPGALAASVGAAFQMFGGADLYPGRASKASHLLYLIAKDHPFIDGNKRAAAFALLSFCRLVNLPAPDPVSLAALALFVAESDPARKASVVGVVAALLAGRA